MHYQHNTDDRVLIRAIGYGARSGRVVEQLGKFGPYEEPLYAIHPDGKEWTDDTIMLIPQSMLDGLTPYEWEHSETVPALYKNALEDLVCELIDGGLPGIDPEPLEGYEIMQQVVAVILNREEITAEEINRFLRGEIGAEGLYDDHIGRAIDHCEDTIRADLADDAPGS